MSNAVHKHAGAADTANSAQRLLLPYMLALIVGVVVVQAGIAVIGSGRAAIAGGGLVVLGAAAWIWRNLRTLRSFRFGVVIAHAMVFVAVMTSFNLHAVVRGMALGALNFGATPWFETMLVGNTVWGLALTLHFAVSALWSGLKA